MANKVESTSYDIQNKWIEKVAPNYFNVNDLTMLRAGLFGYINEIESNGLEDSVNMMNIISNEVYPNKAVLPNSIYAYAALGDFADFNAKPAVVQFTLALRVQDLIDYILSNNTNTYTISRYSTLTVGDTYNFMIDYDIIIKLRQKSSGTDYVISAQYDFNYNNAVSNLINPYINTKILPVEGEDYVFLNLSANQVSRQEYTFMVSSNDLVESLKYDVEFEGSLADFNVYYIPPGASNKIQLTKYYVDSIKPEEDYFCFYQYSEEHKLSISFSAHSDYFKPEFNSQLIIEVYNTNGSEGNFVYNGDDVEFAFYIDNNSNIDTRILHYCYLISNSTGGTDAMSIEDIKYNTIKAFSVRNNIISDNDLEYYFKGITKNCKMSFIKKRDDIIKRIYSAFLLLKTTDDSIIPTNTIDLVAKDVDFDDNNTFNSTSIHKLKPGRIFAYKGTVEDVDEYEILGKDVELETIIEEDLTTEGDITKYFYTCPFLIKVNTDPHFVSYYMNSVYDNYSMIFKHICQEAEDEFIVTQCSITRNAIKSNYYEFTFTLNTNLDLENFAYIDENREYVGDNGNLLTKIVLTNQYQEYVGIINCEMMGVDESLETGGININFRAAIETNDFINEEDSISILNSICNLTRSTDFIPIEECPVPSDNIYMEILVFYNQYNTTDKSYYEGNLPITMDDYCITNIYRSENEIKLFKDINNIEYSTVVLSKDDNDDIIYSLKTIPTVRYLYLYDDVNMKEFTELLDYFRGSLQGTLELIENNFDIDMKFYNTYGRSKYFTIGREGKILGGTSLKIHLTVKLNQDLTETIKNDLEEFIINYIEEVNNTDDTNYLYVSKLIQEMQDQFSYITYIEFNSFNDLNDSSLQIIENNFVDFSKMTNKQIIKYVPEYLNVSKSASTNDGEAITFTPEVYINYV